jgi:septal ring factor EnvC (AmiA/AmiB activator)
MRIVGSRRRGWFLRSALCLATLAGSPALTAGAAAPPPVVITEEDMRRLYYDPDDLESNQEELARVEKQVAALEGDIAVLKEQVRLNTQDLVASRVQVEGQRRQEEDLQANAAALDHDLTREQEHADLIAARHRQGRADLIRAATWLSLIEQVEDQQVFSPALQSRRDGLLVAWAVCRHLAYRFADQRRQLAEARDRLHSLATARQKVLTYQHWSQKKLVEIEGELAQKTKTLETLEAQKRLHDERIAELASRQERLADLLADLLEKKRAYEERGKRRRPSPFAESLASLPPDERPPETLPVRRPSLAISAPVGTPIHCVADGEVIFAGAFRGYGLMVIVFHEDGFCTLYAHLSRIDVQPDSRVRGGDAIGLAGSIEGKADRPGVHFEVRRGDRAVEPWLFPALRGDPAGVLLGRSTPERRSATTQESRPGE